MAEIVRPDNDPIVQQWRQAVAALGRVSALADEWLVMCGATEWPDDLPTAVWADAGRIIRAALDGAE